METCAVVNPFKKASLCPPVVQNEKEARTECMGFIQALSLGYLTGFIVCPRRTSWVMTLQFINKSSVI